MPTKTEITSQQMILTIIQIGKPYFNIPANPNPVNKTASEAIPDHIKDFFLRDGIGAVAAAQAVPTKQIIEKT